MSKTLLIAGLVFIFASAGFFMYKQLKNINQNQIHFHNRISELEKRFSAVAQVAKSLQAKPIQPKPMKETAEKENEELNEKEIVIEEVEKEKDE